MKFPDAISKIKTSPEEKNEFQLGEATIASEKHPNINEDSVLSFPEKGSFAVFDGVGGFAGGNIASSVARDFIKKSLSAIPDNLPLEKREIEIKEIFENANNHILEIARGNPSFSEMGTTISFVQFCEDADGKRKIIVVNAGDSRVYILRDKSLEQVTADDNIFNPELQAKFNKVTKISDFTPEEYLFWKRRNIIYNIIGRIHSNPKMSVIDISSNDIVVITSDGIHDNLTDAEIIKILLEEKTNSARANSLVRNAQKRSCEDSLRSKRDDMTALIVG